MVAEERERGLQQFAPLLQDIAAVALGHSEARAEIEERLPEIEAKGWKLTDPVRRIWAGERDVETLTAGLDSQDSALIHRVLELLKSDTPSSTASPEASP